MKFHPRENAQSKSYEFALQTIKICRFIQDNKREYILTKQLIKSSTSVGANLQEALGGQSDKDLLHKLSISYKEARESRYWLNLLYDSDYIDTEEKEKLDSRILELLKILGASIFRLKRKLRK